MNWKETISREFKVAFSLGSQPLSFRIAKWVFIIALLYFLNDYVAWWVVLSVLLIPALALHFYYRTKTKGWTQSYGLWNYNKVFQKQETR
ncbi:MAG: hypothetical protein V4615_06525 [Bacteroidota bacterium]